MTRISLVYLIAKKSVVGEKFVICLTLICVNYKLLFNKNKKGKIILKNKKQKTYTPRENPFGGHEFKKSLGQNFLRDKNLLTSIVRDAGVSSSSVVLEVGAGAGTLTQELASVAGAVLSMEVDKSLEPTLRELESGYHNLRVWFSDALKTDESEIIKNIKDLAGDLDCGKIKVVANIPYYITTPLIFKFLKMDEVSSITIMVQKEVAERIVSSTSSGEYGSLSVMVNYYGKASIKRVVDKTMFYPVPKVDSAVLHIEKDENRDREMEHTLSVVVKQAFSARRKMLLNNLSEPFKISKPELEELFISCGLKPTVRAEELSVDNYLALSKKLVEYREK